jgi:hypothetical protein
MMDAILCDNAMIDDGKDLSDFARGDETMMGWILMLMPGDLFCLVLRNRSRTAVCYFGDVWTSGTVRTDATPIE